MAKFGIGQAVRRVEDQRFLLGQGRYVDDISLPGQCHGVTVLSPHAHARITRIDVAKAKAAPGVLCVLTGADAVAEKLGSFTAHLMPEDFGAPKGHRTFQPVLNADKVRFVGDRVAFVVAETLAQARDAAELVEVDYEPRPTIVDLEEAAKDGAPKVWEDCPQGNVGFRLMFGSKDATDAAFAKAKHVVKLPSFSATASAPVRTHSTPGAALALATSMRVMRAWACGESTVTPWHCPDKLMSST